MFVKIRRSTVGSLVRLDFFAGSDSEHLSHVPNTPIDLPPTLGNAIAEALKSYLSNEHLVEILEA